MSIQDDMYDVEAEVKGTNAEEAFHRFAKWAGQMEVDLELVLARYKILVEAFRLIKEEGNIKEEFEAIERNLKHGK